MSGWTLGFVLGGVVVLVVAAILIAILVVARTIAKLGATALEVAGGVESATQPIWAVGVANETVEDIVRSVRSVEERVTRIADKLDGGAA